MTREGDEPPPPESRPRFALRLRAWRSQTADRLASASPSQIALSAFAAGLVAGIVLGAASARR